MKPLHDLLLVKPYVSDEITEGGLFIPENARERSCKALVIEVGNGTKNRPVEAKKGDTIIHIKGAGEEININGESHFLIRQADVLSYISNN